MEAEEEDEIQTISTSKGQVTVKALGPENGATFIALGGMGRAGCGPDWVAAGIASHLATRPSPYRVLLPDSYSNPNTSPSLGEFAVVLTITTIYGLWRGDCREKWVLDLLPKPTNGKPVVLAGHSWGGGAAARAAASNPEAVSRLVLISPDVEWSVARRCWSIPTLLIWSKDDSMNPYFWRTRWSGHPKLTIRTTAKGGHRVLESHAEIISQWLEEHDA